ncbi:MAG: hypothetical protein A2045_16785 [Rhodocyclales bacterium GWA2_65_20]|nr:MAG: hypothetical protein A2045_16785 [Rhodocyclales bacterium GWA2_65_20]
MQPDVAGTYVRPTRLPYYNMRWSSVFAGLAVGISANIFLLLLGSSAGLVAFNTGAQPSDQEVLIAAGSWLSVCMLTGAFFGGYVAARASGMRRTPDGILHGVMAWGVTILLAALLATSAVGGTLSDMFATVSSTPDAPAIMSQREIDNRLAAMEDLENRLGLTPEQAERIVDQALLLAGREQSMSATGQAEARQSLRAALLASGWLSAAVLLSLLAAMGGGMLGARATRRTGREVNRGTTEAGT